MSEFGTSVVRTFVPVAVGVILTLAARAGLDFSDASVTEIVTVVVTTVYYAVVRFLETNVSARWGWLLGSAKAPSYPHPEPM